VRFLADMGVDQRGALEADAFEAWSATRSSCSTSRPRAAAGG